MSVNAEFRAAYEHVFLNQKSGNPGNAGVNYVRPYKKTKAKDKRVAAVAPAAKGKKK